ncbi:hypothetical protein [Pseudozobellia thermophila]|uniref:Uncharacterized protein n=1 Tax=Pseudozobellia thermophila TaxID=192903 RepID=A0A1M6HUD1_9FLAO|nr:hypothetical protein [Pseudozobellia thermophila]SHJ25781.1 hypothetical protein SAMN04488513_103184 [Pseudozobellia thermophila]
MKPVYNFQRRLMNDIDLIYNNSFGLAFQWKRDNGHNHNKVQLVFRDTGLFVTKEELLQFSKNIRRSIKHYQMCGSCPKKETCRSILVESPVPQITFAMNTEELGNVQDLVEGTLFQLNLDNYIDSLFKD